MGNNPHIKYGGIIMDCPLKRNEYPGENCDTCKYHNYEPGIGVNYCMYEEKEPVYTMSMEEMIRKIEKLNKISERRWLSRFPSHFPEKVWNGHYHRLETLLKKELEQIKEESPRRFYEAVNRSNTKKYVCSCNGHDGKWGLDDVITPQGGGIIAQASTKKKCLEIAFEVYGINSIFIDVW